MEFIIKNAGTITVSVILIAIIAFIIIRLIKNKKAGKCHCGCSTCPHSCLHEKNVSNKNKIPVNKNKK